MSPSIPPITLRPYENFFSECLGNSATPPNVIVCSSCKNLEYGSSSVVVFPAASSTSTALPFFITVVFLDIDVPSTAINSTDLPFSFSPVVVLNNDLIMLKLRVYGFISGFRYDI